MKTAFSLLLAFVLTPLCAQETDTLDFLFESGTEGYACFRIPAMVRTHSGHPAGLCGRP
jgi:hypothetical protein